MRLDLLTILLPKSLDMGSIGSGKSHDTITPQEVSTILAYANLDKVELNILMSKYLEDEVARYDLVTYAESFVKTQDKEVASKIAHTGVIELFTDMKIKKDYKELMNHLIDVEQSALEKLGDI